MQSRNKPFRSVNIPSVLINKVEELIKDETKLYPSIARFVEDAVRRHIEYVDVKETKNIQQIVIEFVKYLEEHSKGTS